MISVDGRSHDHVGSCLGLYPIASKFFFTVSILDKVTFHALMRGDGYGYCDCAVRHFLDIILRDRLGNVFAILNVDVSDLHIMMIQG